MNLITTIHANKLSDITELTLQIIEKERANSTLERVLCLETRKIVSGGHRFSEVEYKCGFAIISTEHQYGRRIVWYTGNHYRTDGKIKMMKAMEAMLSSQYIACELESIHVDSELESIHIDGVSRLKNESVIEAKAISALNEYLDAHTSQG